MKHLTLSLFLILGLATSVSAEDKPLAVGDVFFCEMLANVDYSFSEKRLKNYVLEQFKFTIASEEKITFGPSSNTFGNLTLFIYGFNPKSHISAKSSLEELTVTPSGYFTYTFHMASLLVTAQCDRF